MSKSRCPACNPIHSGGFLQRNQTARLKIKCSLCQGTRLVDVEIAKRYVAAFNSNSGPEPTVYIGREGMAPKTGGHT